MQIDKEYQRKLKEVNDEAMRKLAEHEKEYKETLQKVKYLQEQEEKKQGPPNRSASFTAQNVSRATVQRPDSRLSGNFSNVSFLSSQKGSPNRDRYRFFSPRTVSVEPLDDRAAAEKETETEQIKAFYKEYCQVVKRNVTQDNQVYIVDILEQLHFVSDEDVHDARTTLSQLLSKHKPKLMVYSKSGEYSGESEDIVKNFFKICCGIQGLKLKQRGHN